MNEWDSARFGFKMSFEYIATPPGKKTKYGVSCYGNSEYDTILVTLIVTLNSSVSESFEWNFILVIFKLILVADGWDISCEIVFRWMLVDLTDGKSSLVQVMAWCLQATRHYSSQCWPRLVSPNGDTRPQSVSEWLNLTAFLWTADSEVHIFHISRVIIAYALESLSSLT